MPSLPARYVPLYCTKVAVRDWLASWRRRDRHRCGYVYARENPDGSWTCGGCGAKVAVRDFHAGQFTRNGVRNRDRRG